MIDRATVERLGYHYFGYAEQRDLVQRAKLNGWTGQEPTVLGTYSGDKAVVEAAKFMIDYLEVK
jgi:hypothetical protein